MLRIYVNDMRTLIIHLTSLHRYINPNSAKNQDPIHSATNTSHTGAIIMLSRWVAALVATGALCTAAGVAIGTKYARRNNSNKSDNDSDNARKTNSEHPDDQHKSPELRIAELQQEVERQKRLRAQERSGRTNAERVRSALSSA